MTNVKICWYLCGLFAISLMASSLITVHPASQNKMAIVMGTEATVSFAFGILAFAAKRKESMQAKWLTWTLSCVAVLSTIAVLCITIG
jgi:hypothetical protein